MSSARSAATQFLFVADSAARSIMGNRIDNASGALSPVPGSPFMAREAPVKVAAVGPVLLVASARSLTAYTVDKESGAIQPSDALALDSRFELVVDAATSVVYAVSERQVFSYRVSAGKFQQLSGAENLLSPAAFARASNPPALDATGRFAYFINAGAGEIAAFHFDHGKLTPLSPASYPAGKRPVSVAVVVP